VAVRFRRNAKQQQIGSSAIFNFFLNSPSYHRLSNLRVIEAGIGANRTSHMINQEDIPGPVVNSS